MEKLTVDIDLDFNREAKVLLYHEAADGTSATFVKTLEGLSAFDRCRKVAINGIVAWSNFGRVGLWSWANQIGAELMPDAVDSDEIDS